MTSRLDLIKEQIEQNNPNSGLLAMSDDELISYIHTNKFNKEDYDKFKNDLLSSVDIPQQNEIENPYQQGWGEKVYQSMFGAFGEKGPLGMYPKEVRRTVAGIPQNIAEGSAKLLDFLRLKDKAPESVRKSAEEFVNFTTTTLAGPELMKDGKVEDPETLTGTLVKELGSFAVPYAGSLKALNAAQKATEARKIKKINETLQGARVKKIKPKFPKTLAATKVLASGEIASQFVIDPEDAIVGEFLGNYIGDDQETLKQVIDFVTADADKTEGENRVALLFDGLFFSGAIGAVVKIGGLTFRSGKEMFNYFKSVKNSATPEQKETIVETIKEATESPRANKTPTELTKPGGDDTPKKMWSESSNAFLRSISQGANELKQVFGSSRGFFTPEAYKLFNDSKNAKLAWSSKGEQLMTRMERQIRSLAKEGRWFKVNEREQDRLTNELYKFLKGEIKDTDLPPSMQPTAREMRDTVDELSSTLAQTKFVDADLKKEIIDNLGTYLRKTYKKFENKSWKPSKEVIEKAENFVFRKLSNPRLKRSKGKSEEVLREEAKAAVKLVLENARDSKNFFDFTDIIYGAKDGKKLFQERKKLAPSIRNLLGEETDPGTRVFSTIRTLSDYLYDRSLMEKYYRLGKDKFFFDDPTGKYLRKITGKQFGPLDGQYTDNLTYLTLVKPFSGAIQKSFTDTFVGKTFTEVGKLIFAAKGFAQSAATVLNNITHERNLFGSAKILLNNGINPLSKDTWDSLRVVTTKIRGTGKKEYQDLYNKYLRLGIVNQNARLGDLRLLMESASNTNAVRWMDKFNPFTKVKQGYKKIEDVYVAEDDIWKIVAFEKELQTLQKAYPNKSISELEQMAASIVRNTMPTYDMIPTGIKALRYSPYGNFFSFHVERFRNVFHTYRQGYKELTSGNKELQKRGALRLSAQSLLGTGVGASSVDYVTGNTSGLTEEERYHLKQINKQDYSGDRWIWDMNKDGEIVWADLKFNDPDAPVNETILYPIYDAIFGKGKLDDREFDQRLGQAFSKSLKEFFEPLTTETLLSEAVIDKIFRNGITEEGQFIDGWIESESPDFEIYANNEVASWKHIGEKLYKVGALKNLERYFKAKKGQEDIYGVGYDLQSEKFANFTGFRFNTIDDKRLLKNLHMEFFKLNREKTNARTLLRSKVNKPETTMQDVISNVTLANKMYYRQYVKTKSKLFSLNELMEIDKIRQEEGKEKRYNLNKSKIDLVIDERINDVVTREDFKRFDTSTEYYKPLTLSEDKIDEFIEMHPNVDKDEFKSILKQIDNDFRKLPLLELKENYTDDEREAMDRLGLAVGGLVKGPDVVPFTKEDPSERINPLTGLTYKQEADRVRFKEGGQTSLVDVKNVERLMFNVANRFTKTESETDFINTFSNTVSSEIKDLNPRSIALVTARVLDQFYPKERNRNSDMRKSFSFGNYANQTARVLEYNENVAINRINKYLESESAKESSGWNPTKTASLLKGDVSFMKNEEERLPLNAGGIILRKMMNIKKAGKDVEDIDYDRSAAQKTQIATTGGTYAKASQIMDDYKKYNSLDYGSGIQVNQARNVLKADTYEPYPQVDKADKYGMPDFVKPNEINKKYNFITNFSVLNVLPKVDRDRAVKHIGSLLDSNGIAVITVRSKDDVLKALPNAKRKISDSELITARGTYQKGFTKDELKKYLNETLGSGFEVTDLPNKYKMSGVGVIIKKLPRQQYNLGSIVLRKAMPKKAPTDQELKTGVYNLNVSQKRIDNDPEFEGFSVYHGSPFNFQKFEAGDRLLTGEGANAFGKGLYFTETEDIAKTYRKQLTKKSEIQRLDKERETLEKTINEKRNDGKNADLELQKLSDILIQQDGISKGTIDVSSKGYLYKANIKTSKHLLVDWNKPVSSHNRNIVYSFESVIDRLNNQQLEDFINVFSEYPAFTREDTIYSRAQLLSDAKYTMSEARVITKDGKKRPINVGDVIPVLNRLLNKGKGNTEKIYVENILQNDGVQGIKYFDGLTRNKKGKKQRNYVIFDPRIIEISKKYAVPIPLAGKMLMEMDGENGTRLKFAKGGKSRTEEYKERLQDLEDYISKNRLVSKEAQMNALIGEGYTDPRFIKTTGNELIDKYGMQPFPAEGSGQELSTKELGMKGKDSVISPNVLGTYNYKEDVIKYKDISDVYKSTSPKQTQIHEIVHRAAKRSGWLDNFYKDKELKELAPRVSGTRGMQLKHVIDEALSHSYDHTLTGKEIDDKELKEKIRFRVSKFNIRDDYKEKVTEDIFKSLPALQNNFEKYLKELDNQ